MLELRETDMASDAEIKMYNDIVQKGCCKRCTLRYLGYCKTLISFDYPNTSLVNFGFLSPMEEFDLGPPNKIKKTNPCVVCLGLLDDPILEEMLAHKDLTKALEYESKTFTAYITYPICVKVRDHSMQLYLKHTFPDVFKEVKVVQIKHAWRSSIQNRLCKIVKKTYSALEAKFTLHFHAHYDLDVEELESFARGKPQMSRHQINTLLHTISDEEFRELANVPPKVPFYGVTFQNLNYFSEMINAIGVYFKYSRKLSQLASENTECIENYVCDAFREVAGNCKSISFTASGYDESTVRLLVGRSFHIQITEPKYEKISSSQFRQIEKLLKKHKGFRIKNLRQDVKRDIQVILNTEQNAPRSFKILALVQNCKNIHHSVNAINMYSQILVQQRTPIRVVHQRPLMKRKFKIYSIKAKVLRENLMELDLIVDSGLQLQEFLNGDLGRTTPSISEIIRAKVNLLAMDILGFQAALACAIEDDIII